MKKVTRSEQLFNIALNPNSIDTIIRSTGNPFIGEREFKIFASLRNQLNSLDNLTENDFLIMKILLGIKQNPNLIMDCRINIDFNYIPYYLISNLPRVMKDFPVQNSVLRMEAVSSDPLNIAYIHNPTDEEQLRAVHNPSVWQYINGPICKKAQLVLVLQDSTIFKHLHSKYFEVQRIAVLDNPFNIQYIFAQSEEIQLLALSKNKNTIKFLRHPSKD